MFRSLSRRCSKWFKSARGKMSGTSSSRDLSTSVSKMISKPAEQSGSDEFRKNALPQIQLHEWMNPHGTGASIGGMDEFKALPSFSNSKGKVAMHSSTNTEQPLVVKLSKRQREAYKQTLAIDNDESAKIEFEKTEGPKKRKMATQSNAVPVMTGASISPPPQTPPPDSTPELQTGGPTFGANEPFTPDHSLHISSKPSTSNSEFTPAPQPIPRINQIDLLKITTRPTMTPQPDSTQSPATGTGALEAFDRAQGYKKSMHLHEAETDLLRAFELYKQAKGPDSAEVLRTMSSLAEIYEDQTRPTETIKRKRNCYVFCG